MVYKNNIYKLARIVKWPKKLMIIVFFLSIMTSLNSLIIPILLKNNVDLLFNKQSSLNYTYICLFLSLYLFNTFLSALTTYMLGYIGEKIVYQIRKYMWKHVLDLEFSFFLENETGNILSRLTNDVAKLSEFLTIKLPQSIPSSLTLIGSLIILFYFDWKLSLTILIVLPITLLILFPLGKK